MKTVVLDHHPFQQLAAHVGSGVLGDVGHGDLLDHAGQATGAEDAKEDQANRPECAGVAGGKDVVEHRLHHVAERAQHRAFDGHEEDRDQKQPGVFFEEAPPQPDEKALARFAFGLVGLAHVACTLFFRGWRPQRSLGTLRSAPAFCPVVAVLLPTARGKGGQA